MTSKSLRDRWTQPAFVEENRPILEKVFTARLFSGSADLRGLIANLAKPQIILPSYDLSNAELDGIDFSYANMSCRFNFARVKHCVFHEVLFDNCHMSHARFDHCDFGAARLHTPWLTDAVFSDCSFVEAHLGKGGRIAHEGGLRVSFVRCDFSNATFRALKLQGARFVDCQFDGAVIRNCFVFNWRCAGSAPTQRQFVDCEYRGLNTGILE